MSAQDLRAQELAVHRGRRPILEGVSVEVLPGELVAVVGPSGAGKSTLLNTLSGELRPAGGDIQLMGRALQDWAPLELAKHRAVLPQSSPLAFPFPVLDVVLMGRAPYGGRGQTRADRLQALTALERAGVGHLSAREYLRLSGGERQRVQFARALAQVDFERRDPRFLLLDEPTASLDIAHAWSILSTAKELTERSVGVLCVLHDLNLAASFADRVLLIAAGRLRAAGAPREVLTPTIIQEFFDIQVDIVEHPGAQAPLIAVRGASLSSNEIRESEL